MWVVAEGSELAVQLNATTLEEEARVAVNGAPRAILGTEAGGAWVHASQTFELQYLMNGASTGTYAVGTDPRPTDLAAGQLHFVRPGEGYGANFSCNSCHLEGVGDTRNWPAGPLQLWETSRPMMWLEGTAPLGWGAYVADVQTFGYTGFTSIINKWPDAVDGDELGTYLASLMPLPANGWTPRR